MSDLLERVAEELALSLGNAVDIQTTGKRGTSRWPHDFSPHEQAIYRLVATRIASTLNTQDPTR